MARLSTPGRESSPDHAFNRSSAELGLLLSRLTKNIIHADPEREQRLRTSEHERAKLGANLEYARAALTKLERETMELHSPTLRAKNQTDLNQKREQLDSLLDRLDDFHKMAVDPEDDDSEGEDLLAGIVPTPSASESITSTTTDVPIATPSTTTDPAEPSIPDPQPQAQADTEPEPEPPTPQAPPTEPPTQTISTLRPRTSHATARQALFASKQPKSPSSTAEPETTTATAEAILSREASEREYLADRVLQMAQALKKKQIDISADLESEKDILGQATEGMERAGKAMDTVRGAMGTVTRMAEGEGWWGRMLLYVWIYGMMVGMVLLVFVFPKLRF